MTDKDGAVLVGYFKNNKLHEFGRLEVQKTLKSDLKATISLLKRVTTGSNAGIFPTGFPDAAFVI